MQINLIRGWTLNVNRRAWATQLTERCNFEVGQGCIMARVGTVVASFVRMPLG